MATDKQTELFDRLINERELPEGSSDPEALKAQFRNVSNPSDWIERLLSLPEKGKTPPPF